MRETIYFLVSGLGYLCYLVAVFDFMGMFFSYDITGVVWSPMALSGVGWLFLSLANSIYPEQEGENYPSDTPPVTSYPQPDMSFRSDSLNLGLEETKDNSLHVLPNGNSFDLSQTAAKPKATIRDQTAIPTDTDMQERGLQDRMWNGLDRVSFEADKMRQKRALEGQINVAQQELGQRQASLGHLVFTAYQNGRIHQPALDPLCQELLKLNQEIATYQLQINTLKNSTFETASKEANGSMAVEQSLLGTLQKGASNLWGEMRTSTSRIAFEANRYNLVASLQSQVKRVERQVEEKYTAVGVLVAPHVQSSPKETPYKQAAGRIAEHEEELAQLQGQLEELKAMQFVPEPVVEQSVIVVQKEVSTAVVLCPICDYKLNDERCCPRCKFERSGSMVNALDG